MSNHSNCSYHPLTTTSYFRSLNHCVKGSFLMSTTWYAPKHCICVCYCSESHTIVMHVWFAIFIPQYFFAMSIYYGAVLQFLFPSVNLLICSKQGASFLSFVSKSLLLYYKFTYFTWHKCHGMPYFFLPMLIYFNILINVFCEKI